MSDNDIAATIALDVAALAYFAAKGAGGGPPMPHNANGLSVRRVMQLVADFSGKPFDQLRILDLACGEGVYAIEAALKGAEVRAIDARTQRMNEGEAIARRLGLDNLTFEQADIRGLNAASHRQWDVVLFLGILYHLDLPDIAPVLSNLYDLCDGALIIDTHIALSGAETVEEGGRQYAGKRYREHGEDDAASVREGRAQASIDNPSSFWLTKDSLVAALQSAGFTSICECHAPLAPGKPNDRITLVAMKGKPVALATYPWVNAQSEAEIERLTLETAQTRGAAGKTGMRGKVVSSVNMILRPLGLEIRRV